MIVSWDWDAGSWLLFFYFSSIFLSFSKLQAHIKIRVGVISGTLKARMLKLCIHMDNQLLYCGIENQTPCFYSPLYLSIFLPFKAKFVSQFSPEMCKLESSNMVYISRMSDYIVELRLRVMALIFLFLSIFRSFPFKTC